MLKRFANFWRNAEAATAVEYAVMLALILMVVFGAIVLLGSSTKSSLDNANAQLGIYGFGGGGS